MSLTYDQFMKKMKFNENTIFCKMLNINLNHQYFQYNVGENIDTISFDPSGSCKSGGLYFTTFDYISEFYGHGIYIATIKLCEDANFYIDPEGKKYKTDKFIIEKYELPQTYHFTEWDTWTIINYINNAIHTIGVSIDTRKDICINAVKARCNVFKHIRKEFQTLEMCLDVIKEKIFMFEYVNKDLQTAEMCLNVVKSDINLFKYVRQDLQTEAMCLDAVKSNVELFVHVRKDLQTKAMCLYAVKTYVYLFPHVREDLQTVEMCFDVIRWNVKGFQFIKKDLQTNEMCKCALTKSLECLKYIRSDLLTQELYKFALLQSVDASKYVPEEMLTVAMVKKYYEKHYRKRRDYDSDSGNCSDNDYDNN